MSQSSRHGNETPGSSGTAEPADTRWDERCRGRSARYAHGGARTRAQLPAAAREEEVPRGDWLNLALGEKRKTRDPADGGGVAPDDGSGRGRWTCAHKGVQRSRTPREQVTVDEGFRTDKKPHGDDNLLNV